MVPFQRPRNHPSPLTHTSIPTPNPSPINPNHLMNPNPFISAPIQHSPRPHPRPRPHPSRFWHNPPTTTLTEAEAHLVHHHHPSLAPIDKAPFPAFLPRRRYVNSPLSAPRNISDSETSETSSLSDCSNVATYGASSPYHPPPPPPVVTVHDATTNKVIPLKDLPFRTRPGNPTTAAAKPISPVALASHDPSAYLNSQNQTYSGGHILDDLRTRMQALNRLEDERQRHIRSSLTQSQPQPHPPTGPYIAPSAATQTQEPPRQLYALTDPYNGPLFPPSSNDEAPYPIAIAPPRIKKEQNAELEKLIEQLRFLLARLGPDATPDLKKAIADSLIAAGMQREKADLFIEGVWPIHTRAEAQTGAEVTGARAPALAQKQEHGVLGQEALVYRTGVGMINADEGVNVGEGLVWAEDERVEMERRLKVDEEIKERIVKALKKTPQRPTHNAPVAPATQRDETPLSFRKKHAKEDTEKYLVKLKHDVRTQFIRLSAPATPDLKQALAEELIGAGMNRSAASMFVTVIAAQAEAQVDPEAARASVQAQKQDSEAVRRCAPVQIQDNPEAWEAWEATRLAENAELNRIVDEADALKARVEASTTKDLPTLQEQLRVQLAIAGNAARPELHGALARELEKAGMSASTAMAWVEEERLLVRDEEERKEKERARKKEKEQKLERWKVKRVAVRDNMDKIDAEEKAHEIAERYAERIKTKGKVESERGVKPYPDVEPVSTAAQLQEHRKRGEKSTALGGENWLRVDVIGEMCSLDGQIYTFLNKARSNATTPSKVVEHESGKGGDQANEKTNSSGPPESSNRAPPTVPQQDVETPKRPEHDPRKALSCTGYPDCLLRFCSFDELARYIEDCPIENPPTDAEDDWAVIPGPSSSPSSSSLNEDAQDGQTPYLSFEYVGYPRCTRRFTRQEDLENHIEYSHGEDFAFPDAPGPGPLDEWTLLRFPSSSPSSPPSDPNTFSPLTSPRLGPIPIPLPFRPKPKTNIKPDPRLTLRGGCLSALLPPSWTTRLDDDAEVPAALWYFSGGKPPKKGEKLPTGKQLREWKKKSKGEGWGEKGRGEVREFGYVVSRGNYFRDKKEKKGEGEKKDGEGGGDGSAEGADAPAA